MKKCYWAILLSFIVMGCTLNQNNEISGRQNQGTLGGTTVTVEIVKPGTENPNAVQRSIEVTENPVIGALISLSNNSGYFRQESWNPGGNSEITFNTPGFETYYLSVLQWDSVGKTNTEGTAINITVGNNYTVRVLLGGHIEVEANPGTNGSSPRVYISGYYYQGSGYVPCYWIGTTRIDLPESGRANCIDAENNNVYVAGCCYEGNNTKPCYWINGTRVVLPIAGTSGEAYSIKVVNGTVYTCGLSETSTNRVACYWIGTNRTDLPVQYESIAYAMDIADGIVYTAGYCISSGWFNPCYWAGTNRTDLPAGIDKVYWVIWDIKVTNGMVYSASAYINSPIGGLGYYYWEGKTRKEVVGKAASEYIRGIAVINGSVVTSGYYESVNGSNPCYWTGNSRVDLLTDTQGAIAEKVTFFNSIVYNAGIYVKGGIVIPCYWANNVRTDISSPGVTDIRISKIVVK
jgi:hypothetical protein